MVRMAGRPTPNQEETVLDIANNHYLFKDQYIEEFRKVTSEAVDMAIQLGNSEFSFGSFLLLADKEWIDQVFELLVRLACSDGSPNEIELKNSREYKEFHKVSDEVLDRHLKKYYKS